jgi:hypothetical protein
MEAAAAACTFKDWKLETEKNCEQNGVEETAHIAVANPGLTDEHLT